MDLAWISLAALLIVIVVSCTNTVNPGLLAIALAWVLAIYVAAAFGSPLSIRELVTGFPAELCLTLIGVSHLFSLAQVNGTLDRLANYAVRFCRGNKGLIPLAFFGLAVVLSSIGAGNIAGTALLAPLAMALAHRASIPALLMAIVVAHGALAGALSPFAPTGIIADKLFQEKLGLVGYGVRLFGYNLAANAIVGLGGYFVLGGWRLFRQTYHDSGLPENGTATSERNWSAQHTITLAVIACLILGVIFFQVHVGLGAFAGAVVLTLLKVSDERKALQLVPWSVILMVCGVTVLTSLLERTGGLDRFGQIVGQVSNPKSVTGIIALLTGGLSVYSSTSGVVLPAILPMVPKLMAQLGGGDPAAVAYSVAVSGHLVDSSPLSTIGALCIAAHPCVEGRQELFSKMMAWGLSMAIVGAIVCYLLFGLGQL